jgi:hypothetical protein
LFLWQDFVASVRLAEGIIWPACDVLRVTRLGESDENST